MNFVIDFPLILALDVLILKYVNGVKYSAITTSRIWPITELYLEKWNEDQPSHLDPTTKDASNRLKICEEISKSGFFKIYGQYHGEQPVDMRAIYPLLKDEPKHRYLFQRIYKAVESPNSPHDEYKYENPYTAQEFEIFTMNGYVHKKEQVFQCLLKQEESDEFVSLYVSKGYNLLGGLQHIQRFVFPSEDEELLLAEASGEAVTWPYFNVELHYLELKNRYDAVKGYDGSSLFSNSVCREDPLCRLNSVNLGNNQLFRLCAMVFSSAYFEDKVLYARPVSMSRYYRMRVTFRTEEGVREAAGRGFGEVTLLCYATNSDYNATKYFISRAYNANHVFVYECITNPLGREELFLIALITNMGIVNDHLNFGDVEL